MGDHNSVAVARHGVLHSLHHINGIQLSNLSDHDSVTVARQGVLQLHAAQLRHRTMCDHDRGVVAKQEDVLEQPAAQQQQQTVGDHDRGNMKRWACSS